MKRMTDGCGARPGERIGGPLLAGLALLLLAGCETRIDPNTGRSSSVVTLPGMAAHQGRMEERWQQCIEYYSPTVCQRRHRGSRPPRR